MNHARAHAVPLRLVDGPIVDINARRSDLVARMAKDLIRFDAVANEADAIRSLFGNGYGMGDIVMCVDDARQVAVQGIVAAEMAKP